jgi:hypothetical protein
LICVEFYFLTGLTLGDKSREELFHRSLLCGRVFVIRGGGEHPNGAAKKKKKIWGKYEQT